MVIADSNPYDLEIQLFSLQLLILLFKSMEEKTLLVLVKTHPLIVLSVELTVSMGQCNTHGYVIMDVLEINHNPLYCFSH